MLSILEGRETTKASENVKLGKGKLKIVKENDEKVIVSIDDFID